jgi:glycosyltransferase 2 family protein
MSPSSQSRPEQGYSQVVPWRKNLTRILIGSVATAAFLVLFLREVDLGQAWRQIRGLPGWTMLGALGLVLVNVSVMALRWRYLLEGAGYRVRFRSLFSTVSVGRGANNILPARGGDLLRIESMRELAEVPAFVSAGTLFAERLLDGVVLAAWIVLGALLLGESGALLLVGIALSAGTALGVALVWLAAKDADRTERVVWRATRRLPQRWHTRVARAAAHFVEGLGGFRGRDRVLMIFATSVAMWIADVAMYALIGRAYDLDLEAGAYFLLEGIGNLALAVPATAAGLGSFDYLTLVAARGVDVPEHTATAYVLTMHALTVLPVTILGALLVRPALPRFFRGRNAAEQAS